MTYNFLFNLTFVTDNSSSVPPSCRWWIAYTDDLLYTKFHCVLVFWVTRTRWTTGVQGYFEKASDWVEWRGATAVHHKTSSRQRGNCVVESNTWKKATSCSHWKLNWSHLHNPDNNEKEYKWWLYQLTSLNKWFDTDAFVSATSLLYLDKGKTFTGTQLPEWI